MTSIREHECNCVTVMTLEFSNPVSDPIQSHTQNADQKSSVTANSGNPGQLLRRARQRDLEALTELINQCLAKPALQVADLEFKQDILQLSVEAAEVPNQEVAVPLLCEYLSQLQLPSVASVTIYGQKLGQELPFWMEQIELNLLIIEPQIEFEAGLERELNTKESCLPLPDPDRLPSEVALQLIEKYEAGERNFAQINLKDEALPGINLTLADLQEANLVWSDLSKASLSHANLTSAQVRHANLEGASLQGAKLQGTDLQGTNLKGANLSWAILRGTNLTDADLTDVNLQNATLERVIMPDGTILD